VPGQGLGQATGSGSARASSLHIPHIRRIGEEKKDDAGEKRYPARRWVVERTLGWLSKCRAILVRYEKKATNYLGLIKVACILLWYRRHHRLSLLR
jgi:DDE family transposase